MFQILLKLSYDIYLLDVLLLQFVKGLLENIKKITRKKEVELLIFVHEKD